MGMRDEEIGGAFLIDDEPYFVVARGELTTIATGLSGRPRSFQADQMKRARPVPERWLPLMQGVAGMKGAAVGYGFAPKGLPRWLRSWLVEELGYLVTLIESTIEELEDQEMEDIE